MLIPDCLLFKHKKQILEVRESDAGMNVESQFSVNTALKEVIYGHLIILPFPLHTSCFNVHNYSHAEKQ